jgi:hypothetical protein
MTKQKIVKYLDDRIARVEAEILKADESINAFNTRIQQSKVTDLQIKILDQYQKDKTDDSSSYEKEIPNIVNQIFNKFSQDISAMEADLSNPLQVYVEEDEMWHGFKNSDLHIYNLKSEKWDVQSISPVLPYEYDSISVGSLIYIFGEGRSAKVREYNILSKEMKDKAQMLTEKSFISLTKSKGFIYATVGYKNSSLTDCEKYDVKNNKWIKMPSTNNANYCTASFILNAKYLYAIGGESLPTMKIKLALDNNSSVWESFALSTPFSNNDMIQYCKGVVCSPNNVLILGNNSTYLLKFNETQKDIQVTQISTTGSSYYLFSTPVIWKGTAFSMDISYNVHKLVIADKSNIVAKVI